MTDSAVETASLELGVVPTESPLSAIAVFSLPLYEVPIVSVGAFRPPVPLVPLVLAPIWAGSAVCGV